MRLLTSADWQLGMRFRQFGAKAAWLRAARLRTLRRALQFAAEHEVDAFLIAGDLFEDHQIDPAEIAAAYDVFAEHPAVPIFIVPGNHDPAGSPGAIWSRRPFATPLPHLRVCTEPAAIALADGWLLVNPLTQKQSSLDPSGPLAQLASGRPGLKVGVTHGSPAIVGRHQPVDFPIALDAVARAGLDFLVLGHWHGARLFEERMLMTGTPEPTSFDEKDSGYLHHVELTATGARPQISPISFGELAWHEVEVMVGDRTPASLAPLDASAGSTVLRVRVQGMAAPSVQTEYLAWLRQRLAAFAVFEVRDETSAEFTEAELGTLLREHPLLGDVLTDLAAAQGSPEFLEATRRLLLRELRETDCAC